SSFYDKLTSEIKHCIKEGSMDMISSILGILFFVNIILAFAIIFFERQSPSTTWAWLMVLVFLPIVGFILYLIFNQNFSRKKMFYWPDQEKIGIKEKIAEQIEAIKNGSFPFRNANSAAYKDNIYMHLVNDEALFTQDNEVDIYTDGREKFDALLQDIEHARSEEHTSELQSRFDLVCRLLLAKKK